MKIGEVSDITGLAPSAIRFYEQSGLLPAAERGANGYRSYTEDALHRLQLIQMAQHLGFSLDTLRALFSSTAEFPEDQLLSGLDKRLHEIDAVMATLKTQRKAVAALRAKVTEVWAEGECLAVADLIHGMASQQARERPVKRRKSKSRSA